MAKARADIEPQGNFVVRTPLLPRDVLDQLGNRLALATAADEVLDDAIASDRVQVRARLRELVGRPEIREAIFVASPSLESSIAGWLEKPDSEAGIKTERGLVRYLSRMAIRPTPFGLFAGNSVGALAETTALELAPHAEYRRYSRVDGDYLAKLTDRVAADPAVQAALRYRPNSSLCKVAGGLRYARRSEGADRAYSLVDLEATEYLVATLSRAQGGAQPGELAQALCDDDAEVTREEADAYIGELVAAQILVSDLAPLVTGVEAIDDVIEQLRAIPAAEHAARLLAATRDELAALDRRLGNAPEKYRAIHEALAPLGVGGELSRLFQVNLVPVARAATLGREVIDEVRGAVSLVAKLSRRGQDEDLARFREGFLERYEDREVPLAEVLDEESGLGFATSHGPGADASPLLDGLPFPGGAAEQSFTWRPQQALLGRRIADALAAGADELVLERADLDALQAAEPVPLPDAFSVMLGISGGELQIELGGISGPSGANLLGRFCHSDDALHRVVREQLAAEEALRPDVVFAELVHLADGRLANISARPVLREHEIVFLGRSGAARDKQISITDLLVSVRGDRIVLRSASLGKEVLPRLTNAHNFSARSLGTYRFLARLQFQGLGQISFGIGPFETLPRVPRIRHGRIILRLASWRLGKAQIDALAKPTGAARIRALRQLRAQARLPRWICVEDGDNVLPVDLDNILAVDSFAHLIKGRESVSLCELWPAPDALAVRGEGGHYTHEIVVPFVRTSVAEVRRPAPNTDRRARSAFVPGSEWLYAKLYTGRATADAILAEAIAPLVEDLPAWFFIRYGDPHWHVRFRARGEPAWLTAQVLPRLAEAVRPLVADGRVWRMQLDTYEREMQRYGGAAGIELSERAFHADSVCVIAIVSMLAGDEGSDLRWRLALRGIDQLLDDLGFELAAKQQLMSHLRESFAREHSVDKHVMFQRALGDRFRKERVALDAILDHANDANAEYAPAIECFEKRSQANAQIVGELRAAKVSIEELAPSYVHMHANRILRSSQRAHELVLYDLLARLYESRLKRSRK